MSDRPDPLEVHLGLLAEDVAERGEVPDFAVVEERARRRDRTRLAVGGILVAAAAVVATLVLAPGLGSLPPLTPDPTGETPDAAAGTVPAEVRELIADERTHRLEVAGGLDGSVAVIWRELDGNPRFALVTRAADGTTTGQIIEAPFDMTAVEGGWVATRAYRGYFVTPDGTMTDLEIQAVTTPRKGDVLLDGAGRPFVFRPSTRLLAPAAVPDGITSTYLTDEGHLVTYEPETQQISSPTGGGTTVPDRTGHVVFAGRDRIVVAAALGDEPDGSIPVIGLRVSRDGGRVWENVMLRTTKPIEITSLAVLPDGSILLATPEDGLFRMSWGVLRQADDTLTLDLVAQTGTTITYGWDNDSDRAYRLDGSKELVWEQLPPDSSI